MFDSLLNLFQTSGFSLWGPFLLLLICGLGTPIPEDIILILSGILAVEYGHNLPTVIILMYIAIVAGDSLVFFVGRFLGEPVRKARFVRRYIFTPKKQRGVQRQFDRYGNIVFFVGRFLPGLRTPIFFTAGSMKVPYWKFVSLDGLAALLSAPIFVWLGHWIYTKYQDNEELLRQAVDQTHYWGFWLSAIVILIAAPILYFKIRSHRKSKHEDATNTNGTSSNNNPQQ